MHLNQLKILLFFTCQAFAADLKNEPFFVIDNLSLAPEPHVLKRYIGKEIRLATTSGCAFAHHQDFLFSVNLSAHAIEVFGLVNNKSQAELSYFLTNKDGLNTHKPTNLALTHDDRLLAVANNGNGSVTVYKVDPLTCHIDPHPIASLVKKGDTLPHGIQTVVLGSNEYIAFSQIKPSIQIDFYEIQKKNDQYVFPFSHTLKFDNKYQLWVKAFAWSQSKEMFVVGLCDGASAKPVKNLKGCIKLFRFNPNSRKTEECLAYYEGGHAFEGIAFLDEKTIVATDQMQDKLMIFSYEAEKNALKLIKTISKEIGQLSYPHGVDVSPDHKILAVSNYGTNTITLYEVIQGED